MKDIRPSTDVLPVTAFRANTSELLTRVRTTKRPIVLTQHGRAVAVLVDVEAYDDLLDEVTLLRDIRVAEEEIAENEGAPHDQAVAELRSQLLK